MRKLVNPDQRRMYCLSPNSELYSKKYRTVIANFRSFQEKVNLQLVYFSFNHVEYDSRSKDSSSSTDLCEHDR